MKRSSFWAALGLGVVLLLTAARTEAQEPAYPVTLTGISVEGNDEVRTRDILSVTGLRVGNVIEDPAELQKASQAVFALGWFSEVLPKLDERGRLTIRVVEYPAIERIVVRGNTYSKPFEILGVELARTRVMPTWRVKQILRDHDIKVGAIPRSNDLQAALEAVIAKYKEQGLILVMIGDVKVGRILSLDIIEGRIASSRIEGLVTVPEDVAMAMVALPTHRPLMQKDLQDVMTKLNASVYFEDVEVVPSQGPTYNTANLNWTLTERMLLPEPVDVIWVRLEGVTRFPESVAQRQVGPIQAGPVDNYALLRALEGVHRLYQDAGYVMARPVVSRIEDGVAVVRIQEGIVSMIDLATESITRRRVLDKTISLQPGRVLTRHDLQVSYQALNSLGYFRDISLEPQWFEDEVWVIVKVTDNTKLGGMNGSVAFEPTTGGIVGDLTLKQRNLLGTGQDVSLSYKRGMSPEGTLETSTWEIGYSTLATRTEFDRISLDLYRKTDLVEVDDEKQTLLTLGVKTEFRYPIADYTDLAIGYRHDIERPLDVSTWSLVNAVTLSLHQDSTDDILFPHRGGRRSLSIEKAGGFAVGKEYAKLDVTWTQFIPIYGDLLGSVDRTLALRLKAGLGDARLAGAQAYELGGPTSVRGVDVTTVRSIALANAEYRVQLADGLCVSAFFDAGLDLESIRLENVVSSTGFEIAMLAAGMFVRLDIVWVLGDEASWTPRFDFGFGPMF